MPSQNSSKLSNSVNSAIVGRGHSTAIALGARQSQRNPQMFHCISQDHEDRNPSMSISNENGLAHCFACGAGFNIISLARELGHDKPLLAVADILGVHYVKGGR